MFLIAFMMPMSSSFEPVAALAAAATDSCTNFPAVVAAVAFVMFTAVGSAMMLPPERILPKTVSKCSPSEPAFERRRGTASSRSTGEGRKEVALARDDGGCSMAAGDLYGSRAELTGERRQVAVCKGGGESCLSFRFGASWRCVTRMQLESTRPAEGYNAVEAWGLVQRHCERVRGDYGGRGCPELMTKHSDLGRHQAPSAVRSAIQDS